VPLEALGEGGVKVWEIARAPVEVAAEFLGDVVFVEVPFQRRGGFLFG
jgi:hypothetical protein